MHGDGFLEFNAANGTIDIVGAASSGIVEDGVLVVLKLRVNENASVSKTDVHITCVESETWNRRMQKKATRSPVFFYVPGCGAGGAG